MFLQKISAVMKELFPNVILWRSPIAPVHLSGNVVSLDIPSDISGWRVDPDRSPKVVYSYMMQGGVSMSCICKFHCFIDASSHEVS